jgi:DNA-binding response OmpR family regulator
MRVLLVEDDYATAQSMELMMRSEGINVYVGLKARPCKSAR